MFLGKSIACLNSSGVSCREHRGRKYYSTIASYMTCRECEVEQDVVTANEFQNRLVKRCAESAASFDDGILRQSIEVFWYQVSVTDRSTDLGINTTHSHALNGA